MKKITLILPFYQNHKMLFKQLEVMQSWDLEIRKNTEIIIVDDCSPTPALDVFELNPINGLKLDIKLFRLKEDLPWNWIACRNIGAKEASGKWLLMTDMDHIVSNELLTWLHNAYLKEYVAYYFTRVDGPEQRPNPKPHPNSYFMTKDLFWKAGGYDENYSGHYGTDGIWKRRLLEMTTRILLDKPLIQYLPGHIDDCRSDLPRKSEAQRQAVLDITAKNLPIKTLSFPYERIL